MKTFSRPRKISIAFALCILLGTAALQCASSDWKKASMIWQESVAAEQKGDFDGALGRMPDFLSASGDAYLTNLRTGWLNYRKQKYPQAAQAYQAAASAVPTAVSPLLGMANAYRAGREPAKAAQACEQVLTRDPLNYTALSMLAGIHYERQEYQRAAKLYKTLLDAYPEDIASLSGMGWSLLKLNMRREATDTFQRLLILSPNYPFALQGFNASLGTTVSPSPAL